MWTLFSHSEQLLHKAQCTRSNKAAAEPCKSPGEANYAQRTEKPAAGKVLKHPCSPFCPCAPSPSSLHPLLPRSARQGFPGASRGALHFPSLKEARARRSLLYRKLEHEKLIHFIHLSEREREGKKFFAARFLIANPSRSREAAEMEVFTDRSSPGAE